MAANGQVTIRVSADGKQRPELLKYAIAAILPELRLMSTGAIRRYIRASFDFIYHDKEMPVTVLRWREYYGNKTKTNRARLYRFVCEQAVKLDTHVFFFDIALSHMIERRKVATSKLRKKAILSRAFDDGRR